MSDEPRPACCAVESTRRVIPMKASLSLVAAALGLTLAACGGSADAPVGESGAASKEVAARLQSAGGCVVVVVYLRTPSAHAGRELKRASRERIDHVRGLLEEESAVESFAFVSRKLALERIRAKAPELTNALPSNPLPDSFEVVPTTAADAAVVRTKLARGVPGVLNVVLRPGCA